MERSKNAAVVVLFFVIVFGFFLSNLFSPSREFSLSERRALSQLPPFSFKALLNGDWFAGLEKYAADQFVFREAFRTLKSLIGFKIFRQKDINGYYKINDHIFETEYPLSESSVLRAARKFNDLYDAYLQGMRVFYAIIPDKNYYAAQKHGYLALDYGRLEEIMVNNMQRMYYISLFDCLSLDNYYRTDLHWRQECLGPVVERISREMGFSRDFLAVEYRQRVTYPFYGAYYGQYALPHPPEKLVYLTNETIEQATVSHFGGDYPQTVYDTEKFGGMDSYDLFLSGPTALVRIENPCALTDRELIIFRDSFGSSLAPLLIPEYKKITLIDLRYMAASKLGELVDFGLQDVLFLYSTIILNNSETLFRGE
jgi:hypothetical protein